MLPCNAIRRYAAIEPSEMPYSHLRLVACGMPTYQVYGADKFSCQMNREDIEVARCTVELPDEASGARGRCAR